MNKSVTGRTTIRRVITTEDVREMRRLRHEENYTYRTIARVFGVSKQTVQKYCKLY